MESSSLIFLDPYFKYRRFLDSCKNKKYPKKLVLHEHHIIPEHMGGDSSKKNLIRISVEDHIKAHILLSECFEEGSYERNANLNSARFLNRSILNNEDLYKIQKAYLGKNNPFYGKKHNQETLSKIASANKKIFGGKTYDEIYGKSSENEKEKRSNTLKEYWDNTTPKERNERGNSISRSLKGKMVGKKNPMSFPVLVDGVRYECLGDAIKIFGTRYILYKNHKVVKLK